MPWSWHSSLSKALVPNKNDCFLSKSNWHHSDPIPCQGFSYSSLSSKWHDITFLSNASRGKKLLSFYCCMNSRRFFDILRHYLLHQSRKSRRHCMSWYVPPRPCMFRHVLVCPTTSRYVTPSPVSPAKSYKSWNLPLIHASPGISQKSHKPLHATLTSTSHGTS